MRGLPEETLQRSLYGSSERNIVIKAVEIRSRLRCGLLWSRARLLRGRLLWARSLLRTRSLLAWRGLVVAAALLVALLWTAAQQLHGALHVDDDFSGVTLDAVFFPLAGLQLAFDVDLRTFTQVLAGNLGNLAEHRHTVPLGLLDLLTGLLVGPLFAGRQTQVGHGVAVRQEANLRILAARADQYDFVNPTGHNVLLGFARLWRRFIDQALKGRAIQQFGVQFDVNGSLFGHHYCIGYPYDRLEALDQTGFADRFGR